MRVDKLDEFAKNCLGTDFRVTYSNYLYCLYYEDVMLGRFRTLRECYACMLVLITYRNNCLNTDSVS